MSVETAEVERLKWRKIEVEDVGKITFVRDRGLISIHRLMI